jgi:hypothetical protein
MTVEAGQWTRLHILNVGHQYNSILTIESVAAGAAQCDVGLLSKVRTQCVCVHVVKGCKQTLHCFVRETADVHSGSACCR